MQPADLELLAGAVEALNDGDLEPFVDLMAQDMVWAGLPQGWLWWRHTPT